MDDLKTSNLLKLLQIGDTLKARLSNEFAAVHGVTVNEFFMLKHLKQSQSERLSRVELAKRMHLSPSTVTRMAAPMEKIGLVCKEANDRDARMAYVVLTQVGKTKLDELDETFRHRAEALFKDLWMEDESKQLASLLVRLPFGSFS